MLYGFLIALFVLVCFSLIALVLIQKGKGSMGIGTMGGGTQVLFGGSGGQDFFQKATWFLGALFMASSLGLGLMKSSASHGLRYIKLNQDSQAAPTSKSETGQSGQPAPVKQEVAPSSTTPTQPAPEAAKQEASAQAKPS